MLTPYELDLLLHIHTCPLYFSDSGIIDTNLRKITLDTFISAGIICTSSVTDNGYKLLPLGKIWLHVILKTPIPKATMVYLDNAGDIINTTSIT